MSKVDYDDLRQYIAECLFDEWCQQNGSDTSGLGSSEVDDAIRNLWRAMATTAIAAVEFDHFITERT